MPVTTKRAEAIQAKFNVTVDFPHLGLHSAAATGNLGLVKYALEHGQPINSVLDGVLPLHAACSGGNDLVVKLLIEKGADVNAPRLPRRYFNDKNRDTSYPVVGSSGSTPLHFACANGHTAVVLTLLMHGAHPDRSDKHGTTPEMLARQNGWTSCADLIQQWSLNKDRDLREKEELSSSVYTDGISVKDDRHAPCSAVECKICNFGKRVRVKRSIDQAINMLRPSLSQSHMSSAHFDFSTSGLETIAASPLLPSDSIGGAVLRSSPDSTADGSGRRPSLPDIFDQQQTMPILRRSHGSTHRSRRPRSAGTDAEQSPGMHKVKAKVSLLNIFKKGDSTGTLESQSGHASPKSVVPSPAPHHRTVSSATLPPSIPSSPLFTPLESASHRFRGRLFSESESRAVLHRPSVTDLHRAQSEERVVSHPKPHHHLPLPTEGSGESSHDDKSIRPGILRPHNRSISSGQSQLDSSPADGEGSASPRALRFDSSSSFTARRSSSTHRNANNSPARGVPLTKSMSSLRSAVLPEGARSPLGKALELEPEDDIPVTDEPEDIAGDEEEEEYGEPIAPRLGVTELDTRLSTLKVEDATKRHSMVSSHTSLSPLPSPGVAVETSGFDCPFSINDPPLDDSDSATRTDLLDAHGVENRLRGDSMSSMSTSGTSGYVATPGFTSLQLPSPHITSAVSTPPEFPSMGHGRRTGIQRAHSTSAVPGNEVEIPMVSKAPRSALDIDIRSISSHAQAEALVQRAQQSILDMQDLEMDRQGSSDSNAFGRTPLSAKLAAYGESLAIERKFKQEEQRRNSSSTTRQSSRRTTPKGSLDETVGRNPSASARALDRKYSLEERPYRNRTVRQSKAHRPNTSSSSSSDMFQSPRQDGGSSSISLHHHSAAPSQVIVTSASADAEFQHEHLGMSLTPPRNAHLKVGSETYATKPRLHRSRTPDPESDAMLSGSPSFGVPLSRVSTAPAQESYIKRNRTLDQERQAARATKLVKMGFAASPEPWANNTLPPSRSQPGGKHRFGGFKGFVQSLQLKGKT